MRIPSLNEIVWSGKVALLLAALTYLGFYVFGLIMGVYTLTSEPPLTAIAIAAVVGIALVSLRERLRKTPAPELDDAEHKARLARETRGF